ncbi:MAG TPA: amidohydrolase [Fimbriimonadaceae bacterium]|nr:amidohydrolase [Fimbriimonadaceae bacterium]
MTDAPLSPPSPSSVLRDFRWGFTGQVQSMLVEGGKVVARGPSVAAESVESVDLAGKWLMPKFIDEHCHILPTGLDLQKLHLGACDSHETVLDALRDRLPEIEPGKWLGAVHYDQTRYAGGEHLTRHDLDKISPTVPILLRHVSGHASVANSAALRAAGIRDDEPDFPGGTFRRDASGVIDGVLLEHAHEKVTEAAPHPGPEDMVEAILLAASKMAELGISCASDMMTGRFNLEQELWAYAEAARRGAPIRFRLYLQWGAVLGPRRLDPGRLAELTSAMDPLSCRVAGIKIFSDGAIGSATAAIYGRFEGERGDGPTSGSLMYSVERFNGMVAAAHDAGYQIAIHSIGDYSTDLVMDALEATGEPSRHRIEHAMILSDTQIERLAKLNCFVTMQPEFLIRFAHAYLRNLGPERRSHLKRFRSVLDAGIRLSFSSDRPIVAGDPRDGIRVLTNRPEGYDPTENITPREAWLGYTARAAEANGDADLMGSLTPGQLADYQVLDSDPL